MSHKFVRQVSITIRGASSVATDSAQIVLMDQSLAKISDLFDIAYSYQNNMKDVLFTTFFPSMIGIGGVFFAHFNVLHMLTMYFVSTVSGTTVAMIPDMKYRKKNKASRLHLLNNENNKKG